jgi:hypothetical protein
MRGGSRGNDFQAAVPSVAGGNVV